MNVKGWSVGIIGIRGINLSSQIANLVMMVVSMTLGITFFTTNQVLLQSFGGSMFWRSMMGTATLSCNQDGIPGSSSKLRNSTQ